MSDKQTVMSALSKLPETAKLDEILESLMLLARLRAGLADADAGRVVPHEQIKREFRSWITN